MNDEERRRRGTEKRREVLGDEYVAAASGKATKLTEDFQDLITRYAWGDVWSRPGLDPRIRSCITVAMAVALNRPEELALHLHGALRNGVTVDELREVLLQTAIYCGVPAANSAFRVAQDVLGDLPAT
ncbi:MAG: 4-carboxymuconolactone decarboxylase [Chloroflexi bacterium]|nr:MAG: 4-carboxymuconolactone decarboxylase [Chloroflexota bacterium]